jgi:tetratricopeptide (TPR) repeat protein
MRHGLRQWGLEPEDPERVLADARRAMRVLEAAGDHEGAAWAHLVAYHASYRRSGYTAAEHVGAEEELRRVIEHARAAGSRHVEGLATSWLCVIMRRGRLPVHEAERQILAILDDPPTRFTRASALGGLADLRAMEGAFDEARALVAENHAIIEEIGIPQTAAADLIAVADVEILAGDLDAAERLLREALDRLEPLHDQFSAVNAAWRLALVLLRRGRDDEAGLLLEQASALDGGEYVHGWRCVLGAVLAARRGRREEAGGLLEESDRALDSLPESGTRADALLEGAGACELLGRTAEAAARLRRAADIARRLGYVVAGRVAAERLAGLEPRAGDSG